MWRSVQTSFDSCSRTEEHLPQKLYVCASLILKTEGQRPSMHLYMARASSIWANLTFLKSSARMMYMYQLKHRRCIEYYITYTICNTSTPDIFALFQLVFKTNFRFLIMSFVRIFYLTWNCFYKNPPKNPLDYTYAIRDYKKW